MEVSAQAPAHPARFEVEEVDMYGKYLLESRVDILFVLRALHKQSNLATVYFDRGRAFFLTALLAVDDGNDRLLLDPAADPAINEAAAAASRLIVTASQDKVKVQFVLDGVAPATHDGRPALQARLPGTLLRLQRREYFRLETPVAPPVTCLIPLPGAGASRLPLLDISGGGLGLMVDNATAPHFQPDAVFADCRFELPEEGVVNAILHVRTAFPVTARNGYTFTRVGCEFVDLPGARLAQIQRYITRIERERKARLAGLE